MQKFIESPHGPQHNDAIRKWNSERNILRLFFENVMIVAQISQKIRLLH